MKRHFNFETFKTKEEAKKWVKVNWKREYTLSELGDKSGWVITFSCWY